MEENTTINEGFDWTTFSSSLSENLADIIGSFTGNTGQDVYYIQQPQQQQQQDNTLVWVGFGVLAILMIIIIFSLKK